MDTARPDAAGGLSRGRAAELREVSIADESDRPGPSAAGATMSDGAPDGRRANDTQRRIWMFATMLRRTLGGLALALLVAGLLAPSVGAATTASVAVSAGENAGWYQFHATGFGRTESLHYYLIGPGGQSIGGRDLSTNGDGNRDFGLKLPRWAPSGDWTIVVEGKSSDRTAQATFATTARGADLELAIVAASGSTVAVTGDGFDTREEVRYWLTGPDGKIYVTGDLEASTRGHIYVEAQVGAELPRGQWTLSAYGQESDHFGVAAFTVS
jgi:hypothetical protein